MLASSFLRGIACDSYENKVKFARLAFNSVKNYLSTKEKLAVAHDMTIYICLSMLASDYELKKKEAKFFNEFTDQKFDYKELTNEYKRYRVEGYDRVYDILKDAPADVRKHCAIMAACCLSCDKDTSDTEVDDFERLLKAINVSLN